MRVSTDEPANPKAWPSYALTLIVSAWCVAACNASFWGEVLRSHGASSIRDVAFLVTLFVTGTMYVNLLISVLVFRWIGRPWLVLVLLVSAAVAHFESAFGTRIDAEMMRNVFETDFRESSELVSWSLGRDLVLLAGPPLVLVLGRRFAFGRLRQELFSKLLVVVGTVACVLPIAFVFYADYASLMRNHRELRHVFVPANFLNGIQGYVKTGSKSVGPLRPIGTDAHHSAADAANPRPQLLLLFVGETARAANFSLGGYARETNPELALRDVIYFGNVRSAGTSTAASLPSMFSNLGHGGSTASEAKRQESLLDVLVHAGFQVLWRDNDSGCKGICDRVEYENLADARDPVLCPADECWDEILLAGLQERLDATARDFVVVLHMHGSHGPGYHLRYPPEFAVFQPACTALELQHCSHDELVNAYDNTIRYTDHVLTQAIDLLERNRERFDPGLLYVSDHGESLGEKGLYLHGMPYWLAPDEQTRVPVILWTSPELRERRGLDWAGLEEVCGRPLSHDHLFHTVLGLLGVETSAYRPELDFSRSPASD